MIILLLIGILLVAVIWERYYCKKWTSNLNVMLWFDTDRVYAGNETVLYEVIENRKKMPIPVLEVGFHTRKELDFANIENTNVSDFIYKRDVFSVLGNQKITREIPVKCTKRGKYQLSEADIISYSILFGKHYTNTLETNAQLYVYPKNTDVSDIVNMCERMVGILQCSKRLYEDPFSFRTIRNYTTDDPMKTINWKASAKTGSLMVNTFDSVQSQRAMVFLDIEDGGILKYEELVEESISIAATLVRKLSRQNMEVGFAYNGEKEGKVLTLPTTKSGEIAKIEKSLSEYDKSDIERPVKIDRLISGVFGDTKFSEDTLMIFITKNFDDNVFDTVREKASGYSSMVVIPVYRGEKSGVEQRYKSTQGVRIHVKEVERT